MDSAANKVLDFVFGICLNHPKKVLAFWSLAAFISLFWAQDLPKYCVFEYLPPDGSPSKESYDKIQEYFPEFLLQDYEIIVIETKNNENVISAQTKQLLSAINDTLWHDINPHYNLLVGFETYFSQSLNISIPGLQNIFKQRYVNADNSTMISFIALDVNGVEQTDIDGFIEKMQDKLSSYRADEAYDYKMLDLTGPFTMWNQGMKEMQSDMTSKDMMMMPFIFVLMMYVVGSWKFIFIVGPVLGMSIVISLSSFVPFAKYDVVEVNPMAPAIMLFLGMALSVDYSMFLLSRFASEIQNGSSVQNAVREMIKYSAHVVVLSGSVLMVSYMGVTFFPVSGMDTIGYAAVMTIFYTVSINITFAACSILAFPKFYGKLELVPACCLICRCCKEKSDVSSGSSSKQLLVNDANDTNSIKLQESKDTKDTKEFLHSQDSKAGSKESKDTKEYNVMADEADLDDEAKYDDMSHLRAHENAQNCYFKLTQYTTVSPWKYIVPIVIYAAMSPVIYVLFHNYKYSMNFTDFFPSDSSAVHAYNAMLDSFPANTGQPYYLLGVTNYADRDTEIWTDEVFASFCYSAREIMDDFPIPATHFHSVMFVPNITVNSNGSVNGNASNGILCAAYRDIDYKDYSGSVVDALKFVYKYGGTIPPDTPNYEYIMLVDQYMHTMVSESETASIMNFDPPFNPLLQSAVKPSRELRSLVDQINANHSVSKSTKFYIHASLYWQIDSLDQTNDRMAWLMSLIVSVIFLLIGVMFKAPFLPLRLFAVVIIPIGFVYGCCVGVYVLGWLDWLNWDALHSGHDIMWMMPCITVTILMGLALDYEIFLFSRVFEYRYKGYSTRAAIILAVANTGPIISSAGSVMAMAFFGMLLQNISSSNQMGFLFVFGVLIDTFVIRPLLVPAMLSLVDWLNWWPNQVKKSNLINEYGNVEANSL